MEKPSFDSVIALWEELNPEERKDLVDSNNRPGLKRFLRHPDKAKPVGLSTTYDQSQGLTELIRRAVGPDNLGNINSDITQARFPLLGKGVRTVNLRVEPFPDNETGEQAAQRLTAAGHTLADTGDLAGFLHDHPQEVAKFAWVVALAKNARWARPGGRVVVPYAFVLGACRRFRLARFRPQFGSGFGALVRCE